MSGRVPLAGTATLPWGADHLWWGIVDAERSTIASGDSADFTAVWDTTSAEPGLHQLFFDVDFNYGGHEYGNRSPFLSVNVTRSSPATCRW